MIKPKIQDIKVIKDVSGDCPHVKKNIFKSVKRIKKDYLL